MASRVSTGFVSRICRRELSHPLQTSHIDSLIDKQVDRGVCYTTVLVIGERVAGRLEHVSGLAEPSPVRAMMMNCPSSEPRLSYGPAHQGQNQDRVPDD